MNNCKARWIAIGAAGASWVAIVATTLIQPHIQVYMTIWLITLVSTLVAVALWMTKPDHGLLSNVRLRIATLRLDEAIKEEEEQRRRAPDPGHLESVA